MGRAHSWAQGSRTLPPSLPARPGRVTHLSAPQSPRPYTGRGLSPPVLRTGGAPGTVRLESVRHSIQRDSSTRHTQWTLSPQLLGHLPPPWPRAPPAWPCHLGPGAGSHTGGHSWGSAEPKANQSPDGRPAQEGPAAPSAWLGDGQGSEAWPSPRSSQGCDPPTCDPPTWAPPRKARRAHTGSQPLGEATCERGEKTQAPWGLGSAQDGHLLLGRAHGGTLPEWVTQAPGQRCQTLGREPVPRRLRPALAQRPGGDTCSFPPVLSGRSNNSNDIQQTNLRRPSLTAWTRGSATRVASRHQPWPSRQQVAEPRGRAGGKGAAGGDRTARNPARGQCRGAGRAGLSHR